MLGWRYDLSKLPSRRAVVTVQFQTPPNLNRIQQSKGPIEKIDVSAMPASFKEPMLARLRQFEGLPASTENMRQILELIKMNDASLMLLPSSKGQTVVISPADNTVREEPKRFEPTPGVMRIRVGPNVQKANLVSSITPEYPTVAKQFKIQGVVSFDMIVGTDGHISKLTLDHGHPLLIPAAAEAVKQNVYRPTLLNGTAVEVQTQVEVEFRL